MLEAIGLDEKLGVRGSLSRQGAVGIGSFYFHSKGLPCTVTLKRSQYQRGVESP